MQNCLRWSGHQPPALPGRFAPYVQSSVALVVCWGLWHISGALRLVLVSGFAVSLVCAPPTLGACLLRSIARAVCPSAPKGLPQNRANTCRLAAAAGKTHRLGSHSFAPGFLFLFTPLSFCNPVCSLIYSTGI